MGRITALWNRGWIGKVTVGGIGLLIVCCVVGVLARGNTPQSAAAPTALPLAARAADPTEPPAATAAPKPTETMVPTFTPVPTLTPNPNINHAGVKPLDKNTCPDEYPIKGNIGSNGKLYHTPGDRSYKATNPERCFATSADAEAAGFSRPSN